ncbi:MAG: transposase [Bacteroidales bacterium]
MCALFRNKYHIGSIRYRGYDYSSPGEYFITICTKNRISYFGKINDGKMILSELGNYLQNEWLKTPNIRPDMNITLDEFVVMPDHFHAIIIIGENPYNKNHNMGNGRITMHGDSAESIQNNQYKNQFGPQSKNVASIIRGIKSIVSTYAKKTKQDFQWQSGFHDRIVRSNSGLNRIRKYIRENPAKWTR